MKISHEEVDVNHVHSCFYGRGAFLYCRPEGCMVCIYMRLTLKPPPLLLCSTSWFGATSINMSTTQAAQNCFDTKTPYPLIHRHNTHSISSPPAYYSAILNPGIYISFFFHTRPKLHNYSTKNITRLQITSYDIPKRFSLSSCGRMSLFMKYDFRYA